MRPTETECEYLTREESLDSSGGGKIDEAQHEHQGDPGS